jgi:hypothetical protein
MVAFRGVSGGLHLWKMSCNVFVGGKLQRPTASPTAPNCQLPLRRAVRALPFGTCNVGNRFSLAEIHSAT